MLIIKINGHTMYGCVREREHTVVCITRCKMLRKMPVRSLSPHVRRIVDTQTMRVQDFLLLPDTAYFGIDLVVIYGVFESDRANTPTLLFEKFECSLYKLDDEYNISDIDSYFNHWLSISVCTAEITIDITPRRRIKLTGCSCKGFNYDLERSTFGSDLYCAEFSCDPFELELDEV